MITASVIKELNIKKERYEPQYNYIRDERKVDMNQYVNDFRKLHQSLVYGFEERKIRYQF